MLRLHTKRLLLTLPLLPLPLRLELMEPVELLEPPTEGLLQALERCEVLAHPKLGAPITTMELARC